ncbi:MAG: mevalonate kinase [bacterium]
MIIEARAYARAGFLGNPSDGYFGKTISIIVRNFGAHISLYETPELQIEPQQQDLNVFRNIYDLVESVHLTGYYGGSRLIKAAIKKFGEYCDANQINLKNKNFTVRYYSSIPRQIGLAGSSAIITATMRALMQFYEVEIPLEILPNLILSVEKDELGINSGLQDRVIQTYEGCVYMNFDQAIMNEKQHGLYERIDPALLPKLYIAYKTELGKVSGAALSGIRSKYEKGESAVLANLSKIAELAEKGRDFLLKKQTSKLPALMNENFDLRQKIMFISANNLEMVETARRCGASAKFAGSGGSIIGIYKDDEMLTRLHVELRKINARVIKPYIA